MNLYSFWNGFVHFANFGHSWVLAKNGNSVRRRQPFEEILFLQYRWFVINWARLNVLMFEILWYFDSFRCDGRTRRRVEEISTQVSRRRKLYAMGLLLKLRVRYWYDTSWSYGRIFVKIWLSSREPRWILLTSIELVVFELWRNVFLRGNFANGPRSFISRGLHQVFTVLNFSMKRAKWSRAALFTRSSRS